MLKSKNAKKPEAITKNLKPKTYFIIILLSLIYILLELMPDRFKKTPLLFALLLLGIAGLVAFLLQKLRKHTDLQNLAIFCILLLTCLLIIDTVLYLVAESKPQRHDLANIPSHKLVINSYGYKTGVVQPNYNKTAETYGQVYAHIRDSNITDKTFFELRNITVITDENGLRNDKGKFNRKQDFVILGDSIGFGYGTDQKNILSTRIEQIWQKNAYNAGVYGSSPSQQVELLYYLREKGLDFNTTTIILIIYEGNDFLDANAYEKKYLSKTHFYIELFTNKFVSNSLIKQVSSKAYSLMLKKTDTPMYKTYYSEKFGTMAFNNIYTEIITTDYYNKTDEYFARNGIKQAFARLKKFKGTGANIIIFYQPTKSRVYGKYFEGFPKIPKKNSFKNKILELSIKNNFLFVDLETEFEEYTNQGQLLFWRDDTHLNNQGHEVIANLTIKYSQFQ